MSAAPVQSRERWRRLYMKVRVSKWLLSSSAFDGRHRHTGRARGRRGVGGNWPLAGPVIDRSTFVSDGFGPAQRNG